MQHHQRTMAASSSGRFRLAPFSPRVGAAGQDATKTTELPGELLEWLSPDSAFRASLQQPRELSRAGNAMLTVAFIEEATGNVTERLSGRIAQLSGVSAPIAGGRADFPIPEVAAAGPLLTLSVDGEPWIETA